MRIKKILLLALLGLFLSACAENDKASGVVADYLKAQVSGDAEKLVGLVCAAYEAEARLEADAFDGASAELHGLSCSETGTDGDYVLVTCQGTLRVAYRGEEPAESQLDDTVYLAQKEGGSWKMCGKR